MFILRKLFKIVLLPVFFLVVLFKTLIVMFENLASIVVGFMVLLVGFGIVYCIYSHRYQEIIIFLFMGMILMVGLFGVAIIEEICDEIAELILDL